MARDSRLVMRSVFEGGAGVNSGGKDERSSVRDTGVRGELGEGVLAVGGVKVIVEGRCGRIRSEQIELYSLGTNAL